jgi:hypothetical protein
MTKPCAGEGKYEFFKTSSHFDWLGEDAALVQKLGPAAG